MTGILGSALSMLGPVIVFLIKLFIKNKEAKAKAVKNYYEFISQIDKKSEKKVENYLNAEAALSKLQKEIREQTLVEPPREGATEPKAYNVPTIIYLDIELKTKGAYLTDSGKPKGLIVHTTRGRFAGGRQDAANTLQDLAKRGFGCMVMDIHGQIYKAKNQGDEIAWHAGESAFMGFQGMSRYLEGVEICNAGRLEDDFTPWFSNREVIKAERRLIENQRSNQQPGTYHKMTSAQEESLRNYVLWQLDVNPEYKLDFCIGHDECAPTRKSDPGGALSMTMPDFRAMISEQL